MLMEVAGNPHMFGLEQGTNGNRRIMIHLRVPYPPRVKVEPLPEVKIEPPVTPKLEYPSPTLTTPDPNNYRWGSQEIWNRDE